MSIHFTRRRLIVLRRVIQSAFGLFCLFAGWQFYHFVQWALGKSTAFVARPASVEAFLPISALVAFKKLLMTGQYDQIHPAGLTVFIAALTIALLFRKGFCGWICPVGLASNLVEKLGKKIGCQFTLPFWFSLPLMSLKYLLLAFFIYLIIIKMPINGIDAFLRSPYNVVVDAKMLYFFLSPSRLALIILLLLLAATFIYKNFWCRYLCPYGAMLGLLAFVGPTQVKRNPDKCIRCGKCDAICPVSITVSRKTTVRTPECLGCLECVAVCPPDSCLGVGFLHKSLPLLLLPALVVATYLLFWFIALKTGHWDNALPQEILQRYYSMGIIPHP